MLTGLYGGEWNWDKLMNMAEDPLRLEKEFNRKAGFSEEDDGLPEFFKKEPLPPFNMVFDFTNEELQTVIPF